MEAINKREAWNKGKLVDQKTHFTLPCFLGRPRPRFVGFGVGVV